MKRSRGVTFSTLPRSRPRSIGNAGFSPNLIITMSLAYGVAASTPATDSTFFTTVG